MATSDVPPAAPTPAPAPVPAPAPAKKSNTLVIVLCVVFGIMFLLLASCVGTCMYLGKKAKDFSKENQKNPAISQIAMIAAFTPGIEVVSKDLDAGVIVIKNKKTGETVKFDSKDFSKDKVSAMIEKLSKGKGVNVELNSESPSVTTESKSEAVEPAAKEPEAPTETVVSAAQSSAQTSTLKSFRSDFPIYTGGNVVTSEASQHTFAGVSTSQHIFATSDAPDKVAAFYEKKLADDGYAVLASENASDSNGPKLLRVFQKGGMNATLNFEARVDDGKTRVEVNQVVVKQQ